MNLFLLFIINSKKSSVSFKITALWSLTAYTGAHYNYLALLLFGSKEATFPTFKNPGLNSGIFNQVFNSKFTNNNETLQAIKLF